MMRTMLILALTAAPLLAGEALAAQRQKSEDGGFTAKLTAPIGIGHELSREPAVGQVLEVRLTITPGEPLTNAVVSLGADDPLAIIEPTADVALDAIAAGESGEVNVTVLPLLNETQYLRVSVTGDIGGSRQTRSLSVAIRLPGDAVTTEPGAGAEASTDESVRSFKAIETVR